MQIGEAAKQAEVTPRTIRYYESLGLMGSVQREGSGFRHYDEVDIQRLRKIEALKNLGLSLEEIGSVIDLYFTDARGLQGKRKVLEILRFHLAETDAKLLAMQTFRQELLSNIEQIERLISQVSNSTH